MKNKWKKLLAMTLAASMLTGMMGVGAWAEEDGAGGGSGETATAGDAYSNREDTQVIPTPEATATTPSVEPSVEPSTEPTPEPTPDLPTAAAKIGDADYDTLQAAITAAEAYDEVVLQKDVTENVTISGKNITLNLGGNTLTGTGNGTVLTINGGDVTLTGDGTITGGAGAKHGGGVKVDGGASFTMMNGTVTENSAIEWGGGVCVDYGTFTMNGGTISMNSVAHNGGGVAVYNYTVGDGTKTAKFVMIGGAIIANTVTTGSGGGIGAVGSHKAEVITVVQISGGEISGNHVSGNGGGIAVSTVDELSATGAEAQNALEITGGTISGNTANLGGGVYSAESITAISGGKIIGNTAEGVSGFGGGVYVQAGSATLTGAEITGNTAKTGGGVFAGHKQRETTVTMTSGKLFGNTANQAADAYCNVLTTLTLPDAASMGGTLNDEPITDWFWDGGGQYAWSKDYLLKRNVSGTKVQQYLIAAYEIVPVAKIVRNGEDVLFYTLQDAINTAEDGETVEVLKNTIGASLQNVEKKVTVNIPEGVTVSTNTGKTYALAVAGAGAELTITGEGAIQGSTYGVVAQSGGTANIIGGIINGERAVLGLNSATINVTDESVSIDGTYAGIHAQGADVNVLVNAGEVKGGTFGMFLSKGASATVEGTAKLSRTKDDNTGFTISLKGPGGDDDTVKHTALTVNGGTITNTKNAAIAGNGSVSGTADARHTTIIITGGEITSTESWGIYHPQQGEMTITGGTITGISGVEMRAGTLNVSGNAVITGTNTAYDYNSNSNGATTMGVGIAVSQHVTERPITANISGGTITGYHAVVEHDMENNPESEDVALSISGGVFNGTGEGRVSVVSANMTKFITGGTFSNDVSNTDETEYVADTYVSHAFATPANAYYSDGYFNVHIPNTTSGVPGCSICVVPSTPGGGGGDTTYYTLTINYLDTDGNVMAAAATRSLALGARYSVVSPTIAGYTADPAVVEGTMSGRDTTITVTYTADPVPTTTPEPTPTAPVEDLDENDTPLAELPTVPQQPATEPPKEEIEDLEDGDVPMAQAPETGDSLGTWLMMSAGALLGLAWLGKKKEEA